MKISYLTNIFAQVTFSNEKYLINKIVESRLKKIKKRKILVRKQRYIQKQNQKLKFGLSLSKKICFCFNESPLKIIKNAFYFILKALFVLKILNF